MSNHTSRYTAVLYARLRIKTKNRLGSSQKYLTDIIRKNSRSGLSYAKSVRLLVNANWSSCQVLTMDRTGPWPEVVLAVAAIKSTGTSMRSSALI